MTEDSFAALLDRLDGVRHRGADRADARCPGHDDKKASLSIAKGGGGRVLIYCHAGCAVADVVEAAGLSMGAMFGEPEMVAEYPYTDEHGAVLYYAERWAPKDFRVRMANGTRRWPAPAQRVLYNLGAVLWARQFNHPIFIVEGEKDVETLRSLRFAATTTLGGAGKPWQPQYTAALDGIDVVIIADRDAPGLKWARAIAATLETADPHRVVTIRTPRPKECKDVTDLIEAGYTLTDTDILADTIGEIRLAADYDPVEVGWIWDARIPRNMLTLLEGDPGTGKSTMVCELIGCLTTGRPLPQTPGITLPPMTIGILADEDNWPAVVVPRLSAAGADLKRVLHFQGIRDGDYLAPYSLGDLATLRHDLTKAGAELLIIDPIMAYLGSTNVDSYRDHHVRSILGPLVQMAEEENISIIAIRHFTKAEGGKAIHKGGGSIGFTGQARSILQTGKHPDREDRFVLAVAKNNLAPLASSLSYELHSTGKATAPRVIWDDLPAPYSAQQLVGGELKASPSKQYAEEFLVDLLSDGAKPWKEIATEGSKAGHSEHTLRDVRDKVAHPIRTRGGNRTTVWSSGAKADLHLVDNPDNDEFRADEIEARRKAKAADHLPDTSPDTELAGMDPATASKNAAANGKEPQAVIHRPENPQLPARSELAVAGSISANGESGPAKPQVALTDPFTGAVVCTVCGSPSGLVIDAEHGARCRHHDPLIWADT